MTVENGGERESLAPVIPLFGGRVAAQERSDPPVRADAARGDAATPWHATWIDDPSRGGAPRSASHPVFGRRRPPEPASADDDEDSSDLADDAERGLLRKLRTRSLSVKEARAAVSAYELDAGAVDEILSRFLDRGYLDDAALAEQLVDKATSRKAQGRQAIGQTLAQRGIPREVIDAALDQLPDDEWERALEFARGKAAGMADLDRDVALRRLAGQLARRGFGGVALSAARQALEENTRPRHGVRFE